MNTEHARLCASQEWADYLCAELVPWALAGIDLSGEVLELGGGYGASTAYLQGPAGRLTVIEADGQLAAGLRARFTGVQVHHADATAIPLPDASVDVALCFTMLHHVASGTAQDQLFAQVARVLRPGGQFAGTDSLASDELRAFHAGDVYQPVDPAALPARLRAAGFTDAVTEVGQHAFRFRAALAQEQAQEPAA